MEEAHQEQTPLFKIKALLIIEAVALMIALVLPVTPSKTGKPIRWPATWGDYLQDVLLSFLLVNAVLIVIFVVGWLWIRRARDDSPQHLFSETDPYPK